MIVDTPVEQDHHQVLLSVNQAVTVLHLGRESAETILANEVHSEEPPGKPTRDQSRQRGQDTIEQQEEKTETTRDMQDRTKP